jgi:hypothetical protein
VISVLDMTHFDTNRNIALRTELNSMLIEIRPQEWPRSGHVGGLIEVSKHVCVLSPK